MVTIQVDQLLAEQFGMEYTDQNGKKVRPYIIHRTSLGCYERTLAYLIEKYAGALPMWMAPEQVRVLPITDRCGDYAREVLAKLKAAGLRAEIDERNEKIGYKIREAQMQTLPYMLLIGDKEVEEGKVSVRERARGDLGVKTIEEFLADTAAEAALPRA